MNYVKGLIRQHIGPLLLMLLVLFVGYWSIFRGSDFFAEGDPVAFLQYQHGNAIGNGWRPDIGFGISFFYGDPGGFHAWSVFSLLEKLFPYPVMVYNFSILCLLFLAMIAEYSLLHFINPKSSGIVNSLLACLIVFCPLQYEFIALRIWITLSIGTPLIIILLYRYFAKPSSVYFLLGGFLFWGVLFLGSMASLVQVVITGFIFSIVYLVRFRPAPVRFIINLFTLHVVSMVIMVALGAWVFYSLFIEKSLVGYVRDPVHFASWKLLDIKDMLSYIVQFFHVTWINSQTALPAALDNFRLSWRWPSGVFPLIFLFFIFRSAKSFWESCFKWMLLVFLANEFLYAISPFYGHFIQSFLNLHPFWKFQPSYYCLAIGLISLYICDPLGDEMKHKKAFERIKKSLGLPLIVFYFSLLFFSLLVIFIPAFFPWISKMVLEAVKISSQRKEFLLYVVRFFIAQIRHGTNWTTIMYYISTGGLLLLLLSPAKLKYFAGKKEIFASLFVLNGLFFTWAIFPLSHDKFVWEKIDNWFFPTDRFYSLGAFYKKSHNLQDFREMWRVDNKGIVTVMKGLAWPPGASLSAPKMFLQKNISDYLFYAFNEKTENIKSTRDLYAGPLVCSPLLDIAAVNYYYTLRPYPVMPSNLEMVNSENIYVYRNKNAWPYFYLADKLLPFRSLEQLRKALPLEAYVADNDYFPLLKAEGSKIDLKQFKYGQMVFEYDGHGENLLVVADAWHPLWKARINEVEHPVLRVNKIFKGIRLPPGKYEVIFYYDTKPYMPGIYISIGAWLIFVIVIFLICYRGINSKRRAVNG